METKSEALERLKSMMGCTTAMRTKDANGNNENYTAIVADLFFDEANPGCVTKDEWVYTGSRHATAENTDLSVWCQEMDDSCAGALKESLENGELDVMSFYSEGLGSMDVIVWGKSSTDRYVVLTDANVAEFIGKKIEFTAEGYMMEYRGVAVINSVDYSDRKPLKCTNVSGDDLSFAFLDKYGMETSDGGETYHMCDKNRVFCYSDSYREIFVKFCE